MANFRLAIAAFTVPTLTVIIGILWFLEWKKKKKDNIVDDGKLYESESHAVEDLNKNAFDQNEIKDTSLSVEASELSDEIYSASAAFNDLTENQHFQEVSMPEQQVMSQTVQDDNEAELQMALCDSPLLPDSKPTVAETCQEQLNGDADFSKNLSIASSLEAEKVRSDNDCGLSPNKVPEMEISEIQDSCEDFISASLTSVNNFHTLSAEMVESVIQPSEKASYPEIQDESGTAVNNVKDSFSNVFESSGLENFGELSSSLNETQSCMDSPPISAINDESPFSLQSYSNSTPIYADTKSANSLLKTEEKTMDNSVRGDLSLEDDCSDCVPTHEKNTQAKDNIDNLPEVKSLCTETENGTSCNFELKTNSTEKNTCEDLSGQTLFGDNAVSLISKPCGNRSSLFSSESSNCDDNSEASVDSGQGTTASVNGQQSADTTLYEFYFPSELCGRLIGRQGKNIISIKEKSGATVSLQPSPYTPNHQICTIEGTQVEIDEALKLIDQRFPQSKFSNVDLTAIIVGSQLPVQGSPVLVPELMQLNLPPEGVSVDVIVTSIVNASHLFLQQPTHPSYPSLERLNQFMLGCYSQEGIVPQLPRPLEVGVICAVPVCDGWFRAQIVSVYEETDECDIKYVDYGGFNRVPGSMLRQIRSDFMTLPFQAVECFLANITPLQNETYFCEKSAEVLQELTESRVLQAQVVSRDDDGTPYVHIYQISGNKVLFVNRELVNRSVVRWIEIL